VTGKERRPYIESALEQVAGEKVERLRSITKAMQEENSV